MIDREYEARAEPTPHRRRSGEYMGATEYVGPGAVVVSLGGRVVGYTKSGSLVLREVRRPR